MSQPISLSQVQQSFAAFAEANGTGVDLAYADDGLMIARCVLPTEFEVRPGDLQKGGVAVRGTLMEVEVRPYLHRLICVNGAIMMSSTQGSAIATADCTEEWLNEAFAAASSNEALAASASAVRTLDGTKFDHAFMILSLMKRLGRSDQERTREILRRWIGEGGSGYSLMNAVTSLARDSKDPQTRWRLEALGGEIPALLLAGPTARERLEALDLPDVVRDRDRTLQPA